MRFLFNVKSSTAFVFAVTCAAVFSSYTMDKSSTRSDLDFSHKFIKNVADADSAGQPHLTAPKKMSQRPTYVLQRVDYNQGGNRSKKLDKVQSSVNKPKKEKLSQVYSRVNDVIAQADSFVLVEEVEPTLEEQIKINRENRKKDNELHRKKTNKYIKEYLVNKKTAPAAPIKPAKESTSLMFDDAVVQNLTTVFSEVLKNSSSSEELYFGTHDDVQDGFMATQEMYSNPSQPFGNTRSRRRFTQNMHEVVAASASDYEKKKNDRSAVPSRLVYECENHVSKNGTQDNK